MSTKVGWKHLFPESWQFLPAKRLFPESKKRAHPDDEQLTASQDWGVIPQKEFIRRAGRRVVQINQHLDRRKRVECDDFVISMRSFQGGLERAWASGGIRSSYVVLKPSAEVEVGYFARLFKCEQYIQALQATAHFIRDGQDLNYQNFCLVDLPLPSRAEQTQIAKFLGYETAKIDALIEKQQELIALLQEKRQAVISHAVTKGLNPDAPMHDSGVGWLGEIPAHWSVVRLKHICQIQSGLAKGKPPSSATVKLPMLRVANVQDGWLNLDEIHQIPVERAQAARYLLRDGDVLMNEGGDRDKLGRGTIWRGEVLNCIHQNHVFAIRPLRIEPEWLDAVTRADYAKFHFYRVAKQSTNLASISSSNIKETPLVTPPIEERKSILAHIRRMSTKADYAIGLSEQQKLLLQERRIALISAAVTGKIDVRGWKPPESRTEAEAP